MDINENLEYREENVALIKEFLNQTNLVEYGEGHAQAFGCGIHKDKIPEFIKTTNGCDSPAV